MAKAARLTSMADFNKLRKSAAVLHLRGSDDDEQSGERSRKTGTGKGSGTEHDHLPVLTCLAPGCKNTFQLPWGYRDDGKKPNDPAKRLWSGVCGVECSMALDEQASAKSQAQEAAFLAKFGLS